MDTAVEPTVIEADTRSVVGLAHRPDGTAVYAARFERGPRSWTTRGWLPGLDYDTPGANGIALSGDSSKLAVAATDRTAQVLDTGTGTLIAAIPHPEAVTAVGLDRTGHRVVTTCLDGRVRLVTLDGEELYAFMPTEGPLAVVTVSTDRRRFAVGGLGGDVAVFDLDSGDRRALLATGEEVIAGLAFTDDGAGIYVQSMAQAISRWDVDGHERSDLIELGDRPVTAIHQAAGRLAVAVEHGLYVLDVDGHVPVLRTPLPVVLSRAVSIAPDRSHVVVGSSDGRLRVVRLPGPDEADTASQ